MYLHAKRQYCTPRRHINDTYKLKNQGSEATDNCTSTSWKWSWMIGKHRCTSDSNTRWSRRVPCMEGLWAALEWESKHLACDYRTYNSQAVNDRRSPPIARKPALLTYNYNHVRKYVRTRGSESYIRIAATRMFIAFHRLLVNIHVQGKQRLTWQYPVSGWSNEYACRTLRSAVMPSSD
jgi:hypothetical protein